MNWTDDVYREAKLQFAENKKFAGMAAMAVLLTIAAMITTGWGIINHSGKILTSILITIGLQGFLLVLAWSLGEAMATERNASPRSNKKKGLSGGSAAALFFGCAATAIVFFAMEPIGGLAMIGALLGAAVLWTLLSVPRHTATMAVYLLVMGVSIFFSFDFHYSGFKPHETRMKDGATLAQKEVEAARKKLLNEVEREMQEERAAVANGGEWRAYKGKIDDVAKLAETQSETLAQIINAKEQEARGRVRAAGERREDLKKRSEEIKIRKVGLGPEIQRLEAEKARLEPEVAAKRAPKEAKDIEVELKKKEIATEISKGNEGRKATCGPACRKQKEELRLLAQQQDRLTGEFEIVEKRLKNVDKELDGRKQELATADGRAESLANEQGIEDSKLAQAKQDLEQRNTAQGVDVDVAKGLNRTAEAYRNEPTEASLAALRTQCDDLVKAMRGIQGFEAPASIDCSPGPYATTAKNYFDRLALNAAFQGACSAEEMQKAGSLPAAGAAGSSAGAAGAFREPVTTGEQRLVFNALVGLGQSCVRLAPLKYSESGQKFLDALTNLKLVVDPDANNKIAANLAALDRRDYQAFLALFIATTIDALILFAAIYGARANVRPISFKGEKTPEEYQKDYDYALKVDPRLTDDGPPEVQKARLILSNLTFHPDGGEPDADDPGDAKYPAWVDLDKLKDEERTLIGQTLMSFKPFTKREPGTGRLLLEERFIHELQGQVVRWQRREAANGRFAATSFAAGSGSKARRFSRPPIVNVEASGARPDLYFDELRKAAASPSQGAKKNAGAAGKKAGNGADDPESFIKREGRTGKPV